MLFVVAAVRCRCRNFGLPAALAQVPIECGRSQTAARADHGYAHAVKRVVIVGNSDGIGLALTRRLLDDGWSVTGISRRDSGIAHERYSHRIADVTDPDYLPGNLETVDRCVYCAGVGELFDGSDLSS